MMRNVVFVVRLVLGLLFVSGVAAVSAAAAPGGTGHTVTMTTTTKVTNPINDVNPCAPAHPVVGVSRSNIVVHESFSPASGVGRATFTDTAKVTMTDLVTGVVYTGHSIFRKSFNLNARNSNVSFGEVIAVKGSDGSTVHVHRMGHMTVNANGRITASVDRVKLTCR
jgi:hypothetical protein